MKKISLVLIVVLLFVISSGCKTNPTTVVDTVVPTAVLSATITPTFSITETATESGTITDTATITQTATVTQTATMTFTNTTAPTCLYTELVSVTGGTFTQTDGTASFNHTISAFKIGKYEVTYDLWFTVRTWALNHGYTIVSSGQEGKDGSQGADPTSAKYQPVTAMSWRGAMVWCNAYSEMNGLTPCYYADLSLTTVIKDSSNANATVCDAAVCDWEANGYRLPSEGEWQYAASYKDGSSWQPYDYASGATADYNDATATGLVAWYMANAGDADHNVGGKNANALGIYDMAGNAFEYCWDWYGDYPGNSTDYRGPNSGTEIVVRGGSFGMSAVPMKVGARSTTSKNGALYWFGFRVAKS